MYAINSLHLFKYLEYDGQSFPRIDIESHYYLLITQAYFS